MNWAALRLSILKLVNRAVTIRRCRSKIDTVPGHQLPTDPSCHVAKHFRGDGPSRYEENRRAIKVEVNMKSPQRVSGAKNDKRPGLLDAFRENGHRVCSTMFAAVQSLIRSH